MLFLVKKKGKMSKEEAKRLLQLGKDRHKAIIEEKEEKEGTKMETELENERRQKIASFFSGGRLMINYMDKSQC